MYPLSILDLQPWSEITNQEPLPERLADPGRAHPTADDPRLNDVLLRKTLASIGGSAPPAPRTRILTHSITPD